MPWPWFKKAKPTLTIYSPPIELGAVRRGVKVLARLPDEEWDALLAILPGVRADAIWPGVKHALAKERARSPYVWIDPFEGR